MVLTPQSTPAVLSVIPGNLKSTTLECGAKRVTPWPRTNPLDLSSRTQPVLGLITYSERGMYPLPKEVGRTVKSRAERDFEIARAVSERSVAGALH
jgi:hypothetical protein